jgi:type 1 glutamine amidotransferase
MKRTWLACAAVAALAGASLLPVVAQQQPPRDAFGPTSGASAGQGGVGPIKVLIMTKGHPFAPKDAFFAMFDSMGSDISYRHVEEPAAQEFFDPALAKDYDVFVIYSMPGRARQFNPANPTAENPLVNPSPELRKNMQALLRQGKGMVFFHHALAGWAQTFPEYRDVIGGVCDWFAPTKVRGKDFPVSGYMFDQKQRITVVDPKHPIVRGLEGGFDLVDEAYRCEFFEDAVTPLLRTDWDNTDKNFPHQYSTGWRYEDGRRGSTLFGWTKVSEQSPIVYLQAGHSRSAWDSAPFRTLMLNAITWAASPEAQAWAKANPTKIFN